MPTKTKTVKFELRGFSGFLLGTVFVALVAGLCTAGILALVVAVPLFFLVWGFVELYHMVAKKFRVKRGLRRPKR